MANHLVMRKFLNKNTDAYVSVRTDTTIFDNHWIDLTISGSGSDMATFIYDMCPKAEDLDERYSEAIEELETIRAAVTATMDELVATYTKAKMGQSERLELDLDG